MTQPNLSVSAASHLTRRKFLRYAALAANLLPLGEVSGVRAAETPPRLATSRKGMVTSPHTLASEAGIKVLRGGGSAMEAAITIAAVLSVTYPHFCGIGGDAVLIVADRQGRATTLLGIGQAAERPLAYKEAIPERGVGATLTPAAAVDTWYRGYEFSRKSWGSTMSWASLLEPAIGYAENGFPIAPSTHFLLNFYKKDLGNSPGFEKIFLPDGNIPAVGEKFVQPDLARSLKLLAENGGRDFYEGQLAARIATGLKELGSPLTAEDLRKTRTREAPPLTLDYHGLTLLAPQPPTQGVTTLEIMGILDASKLKDVPEGSADYYHLCIEAVKLAFLDRPDIADPDFTPQSVKQWLSKARLAEKAGSISMTKAMPWPYAAHPADTVYFGATDSAGRSVSALQSLYYAWGSGVVVGDTGILWHNRGAAFSLDPKTPNVLKPGKRPFHTLQPGMALKDRRPHILYGTQGADGQPQTFSMVLTRLVDYRLNPLAAISSPRFLLGKLLPSDSQGTLRLEHDAGQQVFTELKRRGNAITPIPAHSPIVGQAGAIVIAENGEITGAHDPRSDGLALGL